MAIVCPPLVGVPVANLGMPSPLNPLRERDVACGGSIPGRVNRSRGEFTSPLSERGNSFRLVTCVRHAISQAKTLAVAQQYFKPLSPAMRGRPAPPNGASGNADLDVLTPQQVAAWLQIKPRQVERFGVPCLVLGHKTRRYLRADLLARLTAQRSTKRAS